MRRFVDLHTHSIASDGQLSPAEVVRLAERERMAAVALTDHDTVDGLAEAAGAAAEFPELLFVPGIEVSAAYPAGTMHLLGLGIDPQSPALRRLCEDLRASRRERNPRMVAKLQELGFDLAMEDVCQAAAAMAVAGNRGQAPFPNGGHPQAEKSPLEGGTEARVIGRMHMAEAMRRKGYVSSVQDAFDRYLGDGKPAHLDKERLEPRTVIAAIREAQGVAVLAHPPQLRYGNRAQFERILRDLIRHGLDGLEVYHGDHDLSQTRLYLDYALRFHLVVTGGSDYHGPSKPQSRVGRPRVPVSAVGQDVLRRLTRR